MASRRQSGHLRRLERYTQLKLWAVVHANTSSLSHHRIEGSWEWQPIQVAHWCRHINIEDREPTVEFHMGDSSPLNRAHPEYPFLPKQLLVRTHARAPTSLNVPGVTISRYAMYVGMQMKDEVPMQ